MGYNYKEKVELLRLKAEELREQGVRGKLSVAPFGDIRCFVPCNPGACICIPVVDDLVVVDENGFKKSREYANRKFLTLTEEIDNI